MEFNFCLPETDPTERRRLQNRLAQRKFRLKKAADSANADSAVRARSAHTQHQHGIAVPDTSAAASFFASPITAAAAANHQSLLLSPHGPSSQVGLNSEVVSFDDTDPMEDFLSSVGVSILSPDVAPPAAQPPFRQDFDFNMASSSSGTSPSSSGSIHRPSLLRNGSDASMPVFGSLPSSHHEDQHQHQLQQSLVPYNAAEHADPIREVNLPPPRTQLLFEARPEESFRILSTSSPEDEIDGYVGTLHIAAQTGNDGIVQILLRQGNVDCNDRDSDGKTALMYAVIKGHEAVVRSLLAHGARIREVDRDGRSALHLAVLHRREGVLRILLAHGEQGLSVNEYDVAGWNPLHMAIEREFEAGTRLLLQNGANLQSKARKCPFLGVEKPQRDRISSYLRSLSDRGTI